MTVSLVGRRVLKSAARDADFLLAARQVTQSAPSAVLLSGGDHECAAFSLALADPFLAVRSRGTLVEWRGPGGTRRERGDPLELLDRAFAGMRPDFPRGCLPFAGGAAGYLAYDLKNRIERLPHRARAEGALPDIFLFWPQRVVVHDRKRQTIEELSLRYDDSRGLPGPPIDRALAMRIGPLQSNFSRDGYVAAVGRVRDYIRRGDVYQVNIAQRFSARFDGDPFALWLSLFGRNPAPFYAYIDAGDHQVVSTSMERFLYRDASRIESRPIKGTRPRGATPAEDKAQRTELRCSTKDDAELSMIVDLIRNDLGKVCRTGTVRVERHKILESYANVHHLVSVVAGELRDGVTTGAILRAAFPGGSITGCPKIRAMEIIDELEPDARHVYTGSIGYIGAHGTMDLSIAIRTALVYRRRISFAVGGGIVYDSKPDEEYEETLHKGRTFFEALR